MAGDTRQFVSFYLGREKYGIAIDLVQEIIRMTKLTRVPLSPPYVEGLANLRGTILTVVNGRLRLGLERKEYDDTTRIIVLDCGGRKLGVIVDRVSDVVTVSSEDIESRDSGDGFVEAVAKGGGGELVLIVDAQKLFPSVQRRPHQGADWRGESKVEEGAGDSEEKQFVSFRLGGEEYALDIMDVQEIVNLPEAISQMPGAPPYCEGLATLRGKLLPLIRLDSLLGLSRKGLDERCRVVVVNLSNGSGRLTAGFVVDGVSEVLRVSRDCIEPVPPMLKTEGVDFISEVCNLGGRRLVKILDARRMFDEADYQLLSAGVEAEEEAAKAGDGAGEEEQYITFVLGDEEFGAPIAQVQEIIRVPKIFAVPQAPDFVEGVVNIRGQVTPVVDLRKRFGLEAKGRNEASRIIVVDIDNTRTGLIVDVVREVLKLSRGDIEEVPEVFRETEGARYLSGIGKMQGGERILLLLDFMRLLSKRERDELKGLGEADQSPCS
ncbi:MAG: chemotaxis protein CheW [Thermacetogeniaceae bacterium]